jgi:preprotein translocase subunit SecD
MNRLAVAAVAAMVLGLVAAVGIFGPRFASAAAIQFELRLAEEHPGPGLTEAAVEQSDRLIFLHRDAIAGNADIARTWLMEVDGRFNVAVQFTRGAAERMDRATRAHLGRPLAILLDGRVVSAPTVRSAIGESALIHGDYSRADAERIAAGIRER